MVLCVLTAVALGGIFQISLVQDLVTASGYSTAEVFSGLLGIIYFFYFLVAIFTIKV